MNLESMFTFLSETSAILFGFRALLGFEEVLRESTERSGNNSLCAPAILNLHFSVVDFQDGGQEEAKQRKESPCV